jgi:hypothetical protein
MAIRLTTVRESKKNIIGIVGILVIQVEMTRGNVIGCLALKELCNYL